MPTVACSSVCFFAHIRRKRGLAVLEQPRIRLRRDQRIVLPHEAGQHVHADFKSRRVALVDYRFEACLSVGKVLRIDRVGAQRRGPSVGVDEDVTEAAHFRVANRLVGIGFGQIGKEIAGPCVRRKFGPSAANGRGGKLEIMLDLLHYIQDPHS